MPTTRSLREIRPPIRFSDQSEYLPSKFIVQHPVDKNSFTSGAPRHTKSVIIPTNPEHKKVSFMDSPNPVNDAEVTVIDSWGDENEIEMVENHQNLKKYGKVCAQTGIFTLGCEQDPIDGKWYSQDAWLKWTDALIACPEGMIEYHRITLDSDSMLDDLNATSWLCNDVVVNAHQIDSIPDGIETERNLIYYQEEDCIHRKKCEYDEYAIVNQCYPGYEGGFDCQPLYLITSSGVVYPIEGNTYEDDMDYNPIVDEVVKFLKMRLWCDGYDGY